MLPLGTLLKNGEYRVERYIASGGFGNTYEVVHTRLPKRFAVKEFFMRGINMRQGSDVTVSVTDNRDTFHQMKDKFYKEAQRLAKLEEPHIVEVTDFFEENQTAYYVMKLIDGESLAATMKRRGKPFSESEVRNILPQVLPALEVGHGQGIFHLDLKPGNIMRDKKNRCWLIDFGASKQLSATENQTLSTSTGLSYTPGYAPSEQLSGNMNRIGAWTDFYALGATLYNLLSGQTPPEPDDVRYDGESAFRFPSGVSDDMRWLVLWLMQSDYHYRPQKVAEITARLTEMPQPEIQIEEKASVETIPAGQAETVVSKKTQHSKLRLMLGIGVPLILLLIILALVNMGGQRQQEAPYIDDDDEQIEVVENVLLFPWSNNEGKYGFIDKTSQVVIPCKWEDAYNFSEGLACVWDNDYKYGFIDKTGQVVIPCKWEYTRGFSEGVAIVQDNDDKWGFIDKTGQVVIPCKWMNAWDFSEGLARVQDNEGKWGFIDKTGQVVIPCKWMNAWDFNEGLACVWNNDYKYGFIDKTGQVVIPCKWENAYIFTEGLACVQDNDGKEGYIDKTGQLVIPCKWEWAGNFSEGLARVQDNGGKYGFIDKTGQLVIPCKWEDANDFSEGLARVQDDDDRWHYIDKKGRVVK